MTERFSTTWDIPDFDKDEWYDEELQYHQEQVADFVDAVREIYGEQKPRRFVADVSTEQETVKDPIRFLDIEGGQVGWINAEHIEDKGMIEMTYLPGWSDERGYFDDDYELTLDGSVSDRNLAEQQFEDKMSRTSAYRVKDFGRWFK